MFASRDIPCSSHGVFDQINDLCRQFASASKGGGKPALAEYLNRVSEAARANLLRNLLAIDIEFRRRRREQPTSQEYIQQFPQHASLIRDAFFESTQRSLRVERDTDGDAASHLDVTVSYHAPAASRLGEYQLIRELGRGGFGIVFEALHARRGHRVALKTLPLSDEGLRSADALQRFKAEFRSLADINHPNLVGLNTLETDGAQWFFTMDLVEGVDFLRYVRPEGRLDEARLRDALAQVASGVMGLHGRGVMHRDLKPSNVLVRADGRVLILDFGLVVEMEQAGDASRSQAFAGTPIYAAPEQALGTRSAACDWYAVGVMLYEALSGRLPFRAENWLQLFEQKRSRDPPSLDDVPDAPADLRQLALQLLERDPERRADALAVARVVAANAAATTRVVSSAGHGQLVGRGPQLAGLRQALSDVEATGQPIALLVSGRSGEGKSSLVESFLVPQRERRKVTVLSGRCYDRESVPFKALDSLIDELARYLRGLPEATAALFVPDDVAFLAHMFPVLRRVPVIVSAAEGVRLSALDQQQVRARAFAALRSLLTRLGQRSTVILFIDDIQWGDADSALALFEVLRPPEAPCLLVVMTCRSDEQNDSVFLRTWEELTQRQIVALNRREITVGPLSQEQCVELTIAEAGQDNDRVRQRAVEFYLETGGNPFLLLELISCFDPASDSFKPLPLQEVIGRKLGSLPPDAARLLEVIATSGQALSLEEASQVAGHQTVPMSTITHMRTEKLARLLGSVDNFQVDTYHDKVRETVLRNMNVDRRRDTHRQFAEIIVGRMGDSGASALRSLEESADVAEERPPILSRLYDVSYHYDAAGMSSLASRYALLAAEQARRQFALNVAAEQYGIAARNATGQSTAFLHRLAKGRGETWMLLGKYLEADADFEVAHRNATTNLQRAQVALLSAENAFKQGELVRSADCGSNALACFGIRSPASLPAIMLGIVRQVTVQAWHCMRPASLHRSALTTKDVCVTNTLFFMAHVAGWTSTPKLVWNALFALNHAELVYTFSGLARAQYIVGAVYSCIGWHSRALESFQRSLSTADSLSDIQGRGEVLSWSGVASWASGNYEKAASQLPQAMREFGRMGDQWYLNFSRFHLACSHFARGDLAAAITEARKTFESSVRIGDTRSNCSLYLWSKTLGGKLPFDELQSCCALTKDDALCTANRQMAEGHWHLGAGRTEQAIQTFEAVLALCWKNKLLNFHPIDALPWLVHALRRRAGELAENSRRTESQACLKRALRLGKRGAWIMRFFPTSQALTLRELGLVYSDRGKVAKGARLVTKSRDLAAKRGEKYELLKSTLALAELESKLGKPNQGVEIEQARAELAAIEEAARKAAVEPLT